MPSESFDIAAARKTLAAREAKRRIKNAELHSRASADAARIIDMVRLRFNPKRIYQWGSLLHPGQFDEHSDIDIAVEGIESAALWFALYGEAMAMSPFSLDLVQLEKIDQIHADSIRTRGVCVYERA